MSELTEKGQKPGGFILENVEGLMKHGGAVKGSPYGKTLTTIVKKLDKLEISSLPLPILMLLLAELLVS